ncbi:hypothetical protein BDI4_1080049 [Burkholderia diffusa]|nr:hypothetical protein BDI4_1080049 [Burkholderia diffusa]
MNLAPACCNSLCESVSSSTLAVRRREFFWLAGVVVGGRAQPEADVSDTAILMCLAQYDQRQLASAKAGSIRHAYCAHF